MGINTEKIRKKLFYRIKNSQYLMSTKNNINDLLINLKPKVLRFTGSNFPTELWINNQIKKNKKISA